MTIYTVTQSLSCQYLLDTSLGSEDRGPISLSEIEICICIEDEELVSAYNISFPATFGLSDLRKAPLACKITPLVSMIALPLPACRRLGIPLR